MQLPHNPLGAVFALREAHQSIDAAMCLHIAAFFYESVCEHAHVPGAKNKMNYNICIIKPQGYLHSAAFTELAELVGYGLKNLGHAVELNVNKTYHDATNIIIGCHLLEPSMIEQIPKSSIVIN